MKKILSIAMFVLFASGAALAQKPAVVTSDKPGWHKIGETTVSLKSEKDEIAVIGNDSFRSLKIKVTDQPIHILSMAVTYESGEVQDINVKSDYKAGGESKVIDLKNGPRQIKRVAFVYKTVANTQNDKAHVELYGLK
jgi:hypothetical protein